MPQLLVNHLALLHGFMIIFVILFVTTKLAVGTVVIVQIHNHLILVTIIPILAMTGTEMTDRKSVV